MVLKYEHNQVCDNSAVVYRLLDFRKKETVILLEIHMLFL